MGAELFLAAAFVGPVIPDNFSALLLRSFPSKYVISERSAGAILTLDIDPKGHVVNCKFVTGVGNRGFLRDFCSIFKRFRFVPAIDTDGAKAYGRLTTSVTFHIPGTSEGDEVQRWKLTTKVKPTQGIELTVNNPSDSLRSSPTFEVLGTITTSGKMTQCNAPEDIAIEVAKPACDFAKNQAWDIMVDSKGESVPHVSAIFISFQF